MLSKFAQFVLSLAGLSSLAGCAMMDASRYLYVEGHVQGLDGSHPVLLRVTAPDYLRDNETNSHTLEVDENGTFRTGFGELISESFPIPTLWLRGPSLSVEGMRFETLDGRHRFVVGSVADDDAFPVLRTATDTAPAEVGRCTLQSSNGYHRTFRCVFEMGRRNRTNDEGGN